MFTGIVQAKTLVKRILQLDAGVRMVLDAAALERDGWVLGESIAVQGACLTLVKAEGELIEFDVSQETLDCTTLGALREGDRVNCEAALKVGDALGGHWVTGHVDAVGAVVKKSPEGDCERWTFEVPSRIAHYIAKKGSITVDGVSLTVNAAAGNQFEVNLIPHTLEVTTLGQYPVGQKVNIEVDIIARYLERFATAENEASGSLTKAQLVKAGFIQ